MKKARVRADFSTVFRLMAGRDRKTDSPIVARPRPSSQALAKPARSPASTGGVCLKGELKGKQIMAFYKYAQFLNKSEDSRFDQLYVPGGIPPQSGLYRCEGCGHEVVAEAQRQFPPQNHHQHTAGQGPIRWRLIVW